MLEDAWAGPFEVVDKKSDVNYKIKSVDGAGTERVVHINDLKRSFKREEAVMRLVVVAKSGEFMCGCGVKLKERHGDYCEADVVKLKEEFQDVLKDEPGDNKTAEIVIEVGDALPIHQHPHGLPDKLREELGLR